MAILPGTVQEAKLQGTRRVVRLEEQRIDARVVIDASGVAAGIARQEGLEPMRHREDIAWAMEADIELPGLGEERLFQYWIGSISPGWKATFSPAGGDRATLGVFVRGHGQNVQPFFRSFLSRFKAYKSRQYRDMEEMKIFSIRRGGDPIAVLPGEMVADSLMVTGGAAAQSGLAYSMRAGSLCGSVAAQAAAKRGRLQASSLPLCQAMEPGVLLAVPHGPGILADPGRHEGYRYRSAGQRHLGKEAHIRGLIRQKGRLRRSRHCPFPAQDIAGPCLQSHARLAQSALTGP